MNRWWYVSDKYYRERAEWIDTMRIIWKIHHQRVNLGEKWIYYKIIHCQQIHIDNIFYNDWQCVHILSKEKRIKTINEIKEMNLIVHVGFNLSYIIIVSKCWRWGFRKKEINLMGKKKEETSHLRLTFRINIIRIWSKDNEIN